ncbi:MAG: TIGR03862 family flavoprotein [Rhodobacteraceae bacterium]|nr:TIGR03862 family flavoprotein [Paracoccaceae bacterium]
MTDGVEQVQALVIGGGPAGLSAAEVLGAAGVRTVVVDAMPSMARKFLMAGKSGLNLTFDAPPETLVGAYSEGAQNLMHKLYTFDAQAVHRWATELGQTLFIGSTGRVFPTVMKASPLLRAWLARLEGYGVERRVRWRWVDWADDGFVFDTPEGRKTLVPQVTVLALGGGSWRRLGSDGAWADLFAKRGWSITPFSPSNVGVQVPWSEHMAPHFGAALKDVAFGAGSDVSRGEAVISKTGLEGGGIYPLSPALRQGHALWSDLLPNRTEDWLIAKLAKSRAKDSLASVLRKTAGLTAAKAALVMEFARPVPRAPEALAAVVKRLPVVGAELRPLDEAISTSGGVPWAMLTEDLMIKDLPGVFCAGEMLDWDAPTGGYLLTACFATGRCAGAGALKHLGG